LGLDFGCNTLYFRWLAVMSDPLPTRDSAVPEFEIQTVGTERELSQLAALPQCSAAAD
jgi:hypothetical protein